MASATFEPSAALSQIIYGSEPWIIQSERDGDEAAEGVGLVHVPVGGSAALVLAKIRELEAENARLMRENHDLHPVTPPGSSHDVLARTPPLTAPDSHLHPHPHHYDSVTDPVPVSTNPPFSLDPARHLPDARHSPIPHHNGNGTSGPALHLPESPTYDRDHERDHGHVHGAPFSQPYTHADVHEAGHEHGHGHGHTLPPFKFSHSHSPVDINGNAHEHDSWRPHTESERCPGGGAGARLDRGWGRRCSARLVSFLGALRLVACGGRGGGPAAHHLHLTQHSPTNELLSALCVFFHGCTLAASRRFGTSKGTLSLMLMSMLDLMEGRENELNPLVMCAVSLVESISFLGAGMNYGRRLGDQRASSDDGRFWKLHFKSNLPGQIAVIASERAGHRYLWAGGFKKAKETVGLLQRNCISRLLRPKEHNLGSELIDTVIVGFIRLASTVLKENNNRNESEN
ncbi:hypothetical protein B0H13DRAFT_2518439 [Mycena leptocephala]|nr:hypothetical protein B0H13DRAFT_2518439 [Mycena leptocephala]